MSVVSRIIVYGLVISTFLYVRYRLLPLLRHCPHEPDIHAMVSQGLVKPPTFCGILCVVILSVIAYVICQVLVGVFLRTVLHQGLHSQPTH